MTTAALLDPRYRNTRSESRRCPVRLRPLSSGSDRVDTARVRGFAAPRSFARPQTLELMGRHLALARDRVERPAAQEPQDEFRLPLDAPALREFQHLRRRRFTARSRGRLPRLVLHGRAPWLPSS